MRRRRSVFFSLVFLFLLVFMVISVVRIPLPAQASSHLSSHHLPHAFYQRGKSPVQRTSSNTSSSSNNLSYNGGPVMTGVTSVYAIYWLPFQSDVSANYESLINRYFRDVGDSPLYRLLAQYSQFGNASAVPTNSFLADIWTDSRPYPENTLTDGDIQGEVSVALAQHTGWHTGLNSIFFVFTEKDQDICMNSSTCASNAICGYHSSFGSNIIYAAIPYAASFNCNPGSSPNNDDADQTISVVSHEQMEAATDPLGNAWFEVGGGYEIGDKCAWTFGARNTLGGDEIWNGDEYITQEEWSNASLTSGTANQCLLGIAGTRGASQTVSQTDGTIDTFFQGTNGALFHAWSGNNVGWAGTYLPGTAILGSEPSAVTSSTGVVDVFWKGADSTAQLWHTTYLPGSGWSSAAQTLGDGPLGGAPKAVADSNGDIEVFWQGTDHNLWHAWYTPGSRWAGPERITSTGNVASNPAPVRSTLGTWDVFWKGSDGNLWHVYYNPGDSGWTTRNLGDGPLGGPPQAIGEPDGWIQVVWRGANNNVWHAWYDPGTGWHGPESLTFTGNVTSDPVPANSGNATWDIFWKGSDGNLWHVYQNPGDAGWTTRNLGDGPLGGTPVVTGQGNGIIDVFWKGTNSAVWSAWYNPGSSWTGPQSVGGQVV